MKKWDDKCSKQNFDQVLHQIVRINFQKEDERYQFAWFEWWVPLFLRKFLENLLTNSFPITNSLYFRSGSFPSLFQRRRKDFGSGGTFYGVGLVGGRGRSHPDTRNFEILKIPLENSNKFTISAYFFQKNLTNPASIDRKFGRKTQLFRNHLRKFWKVSLEKSNNLLF